MKAFACPDCDQLVFFENSECLRSKTPLGFLPSTLEIVRAEAEDSPPRCANAEIAGCNWLVEEEGEELCRSCRLTEVRPADEDLPGLEQFGAAEAAKRQLLFALLSRELPLDEEGLRFHLLSSNDGPVMTGHEDGLITLDLAETDDARREARRMELGEPYRTLLGHFRHEVGHFYWPLLVERSPERLKTFRALFGDETLSYQEALDRHYEEGPPADWADSFVSSYATMHPWEDWAETWAHVLHIRDTLETAGAYGMVVTGPGRGFAGDLMAAPAGITEDDPFAPVIRGEWLPLTYALNAVNRAMGKDDLYPFTLAPKVIAKLAFVDGLVRAGVVPAQGS